MIEVQKVGIVTVTYNSESVLTPFLHDVFAQSHADFILYVVDNASQDGTLQIVKQHNDPRIRLIANGENLGVAEGNNQGIRAALAEGCDALLLINNDTEFPVGLVSRLLDDLNSGKGDMVAPKIVFYEPEDLIWYAGGAFNRMRGYSVVHFGEYQRDHGQFDRAQLTQYAPTCCLLVGKSVFEKIGMMDALYFAYFDDADFCIRATRAGLRLWYCPAAVLRHKVSSLTGGGTSPFVAYYFTRNRFIFLRKHLGAAAAFCFAPLYATYLFARWLLGKDSTLIARRKRLGLFDGLRAQVS